MLAVAGGRIDDSRIEGGVWLLDATNAKANEFGTLLDLPRPPRHGGFNNMLLGNLSVKSVR
ncbi:hypothetical protein OP10G_2001 [Fimbriimonas ginsengisoli Gsoil 348]|uniref:Uncharacterized protein n=2 Tax=Fimbriimonas ginsengisoli TaxID=1005039 RepID=A0A068NUT2_FIMGI|nr:hypothetical protein OP10G_2001 [Fimbriimonas ginsengisoli Gsoil 348]